jgi:hypothetical protein
VWCISKHGATKEAVGLIHTEQLLPAGVVSRKQALHGEKHGVQQIHCFAFSLVAWLEA